MVAITISVGTGGALIFRKCVPLTCVGGRVARKRPNVGAGQPRRVFLADDWLRGPRAFSKRRKRL